MHLPDHDGVEIVPTDIGSVKALLDPLAWLWFFLIVTGIYCYVRKIRRVGSAVLGAAIVMTALELFAIPTRLMLWRVADWRFHTIHTLSGSQPAAVDAVVQCGGVLSPGSCEFSGADYSDAVDRFLCAVEVARILKKPLVLGGGVAGRAHRSLESDFLRNWLNCWGVTNLNISDLGACMDTRDEALSAHRMAEEKGWKRIILVTSAYHMRRAASVFRGVGLEVVPIACDFQVDVSGSRRSGFRLIPSTATANLLRIWAIEEVGFLYYRARGWI